MRKSLIYNWWLSGNSTIDTDNGLWNDSIYFSSDDGLWHDASYFPEDDGLWHDDIYF